MIIVADTSPLNYLIQLGATDILPKLYAEVAIPPAVLRELRNEKSPSEIHLWCSDLPAWVKIVEPSGEMDGSLAGLGSGEREAISLALQISATLLIDERKGTRRAQALGLPTIGLVGILIKLSQRSIADGEALYRRLLAETNFLLAADIASEAEEIFKNLRSKP